jgi:hypothetical protein
MRRGVHFVPELGFVDGVTPNPEPRGGDPFIVHPEVVLRSLAVVLRWAASTSAASRNRVEACGPDSRQIRLSIGQPRRSSGGCLWRGGRCRQNPVWRLIRRLHRRLDTRRHGHHDIHLSRFRQRRRDVANDGAVLLLRYPAGDQRIGGIERIVEILVVAVREPVGVRAVLHHDALGHELGVECGGRRGGGDTRDRERQHRLVAHPGDRRLAIVVTSDYMCDSSLLSYGA